MTRNGKQICIRDLDNAVALRFKRCSPDIQEFSSSEYSTRVSKGALMHSINWLWIAWQKYRSFEVVNRSFKPLILRSADAVLRGHNESTDENMGLHDWYLLAGAVLSGNRDVITRCASSAKSTVSKDKKKFGRYFEALAGILRSHINNDRSGELENLANLEESSTQSVDSVPGLPLVRAFVKREYAILDQAVTRGVMKHWAGRYLAFQYRTAGSPKSIVVHETEGEVMLDLSGKDAFAFWAYPEAVFAKLAMMSGATITIDDFWFPLELVRGGIAG